MATTDSAVSDTVSNPAATLPVIRKIGVEDLKDALAKGYADFIALPTHAVFLVLIYPLIGLVLARATAVGDLLPLLYPLAGGFALLGPFAALGLYELSRQRGHGHDVSWRDAFNILRSHSAGSILMLGGLLLTIFVVWLIVAHSIAEAFLGDMSKASLWSFAEKVLATPEGWGLILVGNGIGFLFAAAALVLSVISFPLLLDRDVGFGVAVQTSVRACVENPAAMAAWGLIVATGLVLGSIPLFAGLIVVLPVLGHATWHLYKKVVV